jgi:tetratricopeptide (TPR) repeat protein
VERGLLEPGGDGFRLVQGANATAFPDSLHQIWLRRLDRLLRDRPDTDLVALEIAAALGLQIARDDWRVACTEADANPSPGLVDALLSQRLARREGGVAGADWAFVHGMLRESLERRAREAGRWPLHNLACAQMLEGTSGLRVRERMGRHLLAADRVLDALPALADGARLRLASGDYALAALLLKQRETAMRELPVPDTDPAWVVGWIHRARLERVSGDPDRAMEYSNRASRIATQIDDPALQARALAEVGRITNVTGDPLRAAAVMAAACSLADQAEDRRLGGQCRQARAEILLQCGSLDEADAELRVALASFEAVGDVIGASRCKLGLGSVARGRGEFAQGRVWLQEAETLSAAAGSRIGVAQCKHSLGENHRASGDPGAAEGYYREALKTFEVLGSRDQVHCRINRALCLLALGRMAEARDALEVGLAQCLERRLVTIRAAVHVFLLPCFVADNRWSAWDEHLTQAEELLEATAFTDVDVGLMARLAGQMAMQAGHRERAVRVLRLARAQWARLQRADELTGIELMLAHLQSA